ncbi:uncharacterized protein [Symphalangus syndactylus]|uniref:uncharacterized protein n=1 Tax=Symphalangus syndactylus TaxID=9590 RepID=UPI0030078C85
MTLPWPPRNMERLRAAGAELSREGSRAGAAVAAQRRDRAARGPGCRPSRTGRPSGPKAQLRHGARAPDLGVAAGRSGSRHSPFQPVPTSLRLPAPRLGTPSGGSHSPFPGFQVTTTSKAVTTQTTGRQKYGGGNRSLSEQEKRGANLILREEPKTEANGNATRGKIVGRAPPQRL